MSKEIKNNPSWIFNISDVQFDSKLPFSELGMILRAKIISEFGNENSNDLNIYLRGFIDKSTTYKNFSFNNYNSKNFNNYLLHEFKEIRDLSRKKLRSKIYLDLLSEIRQIRIEYKDFSQDNYFKLVNSYQIYEDLMEKKSLKNQLGSFDQQTSELLNSWINILRLTIILEQLRTNDDLENKNIDKNDLNLKAIINEIKDIDNINIKELSVDRRKYIYLELLPKCKYFLYTLENKILIFSPKFSILRKLVKSCHEIMLSIDWFCQYFNCSLHELLMSFQLETKFIINLFKKSNLYDNLSDLKNILDLIFYQAIVPLSTEIIKLQTDKIDHDEIIIKDDFQTISLEKRVNDFHAKCKIPINNSLEDKKEEKTVLPDFTGFNTLAKLSVLNQSVAIHENNKNLLSMNLLELYWYQKKLVEEMNLFDLQELKWNDQKSSYNDGHLIPIPSKSYLFETILSPQAIIPYLNLIQKKGEPFLITPTIMLSLYYYLFVDELSKFLRPSKKLIGKLSNVKIAEAKMLEILQLLLSTVSWANQLGWNLNRVRQYHDLHAKSLVNVLNRFIVNANSFVEICISKKRTQSITTDDFRNLNQRVKNEFEKINGQIKKTYDKEEYLLDQVLYHQYQILDNKLNFLREPQKTQVNSFIFFLPQFCPDFYKLNLELSPRNPVSEEKELKYEIREELKYVYENEKKKIDDNQPAKTLVVTATSKLSVPEIEVNSTVNLGVNIQVISPDQPKISDALKRGITTFSISNLKKVSTSTKPDTLNSFLSKAISNLRNSVQAD